MSARLPMNPLNLNHFQPTEKIPFDRKLSYKDFMANLDRFCTLSQPNIKIKKDYVDTTKTTREEYDYCGEKITKCQEKDQMYQIDLSKVKVNKQVKRVIDAYYKDQEETKELEQKEKWDRIKDKIGPNKGEITANDDYCLPDNVDAEQILEDSRSIITEEKYKSVEEVTDQFQIFWHLEQKPQRLRVERIKNYQTKILNSVKFLVAMDIDIMKARHFQIIPDKPFSSQRVKNLFDLVKAGSHDKVE